MKILVILINLLLNYSLVYDSTNDIFYPTNGMFNKILILKFLQIKFQMIVILKLILIMIFILEMMKKRIIFFYF